jgi:hypothetical protein
MSVHRTIPGRSSIDIFFSGMSTSQLCQMLELIDQKISTTPVTGRLITRQLNLCARAEIKRELHRRQMVIPSLERGAES